MKHFVKNSQICLCFVEKPTELIITIPGLQEHQQVVMQSNGNTQNEVAGGYQNKFQLKGTFQ